MSPKLPMQQTNIAETRRTPATPSVTRLSLAKRCPGFHPVVQLTKDKHGYNAILTFTYRLTKMVHFVKCKTTTNAEYTAQLFLENVFRLHGLPETLISDRGSIFVIRFWKEIWLALGMNLTYSTAYYPQTDRQFERTNRTLGIILTAVCISQPRRLEHASDCSRICDQQCLSGESQEQPIHAELWTESTHSNEHGLGFQDSSGQGLKDANATLTEIRTGLSGRCPTEVESVC